MATSKLEKKSWQVYFDHMSKILDGKNAEIEVDSLAIGSQVEAQWLPLLGITYDPKSDVVEIILEGLDHMVHRPRELYVEHDAVSLSSLEVIDDQDFRHIIKLRDPLMLPSP